MSKTMRTIIQESVSAGLEDLEIVEKLHNERPFNAGGLSYVQRIRREMAQRGLMRHE